MRYLLLLLLCVTTFSFATPVNFSDPQKAIFVKKTAATVTITVKSNPTTGYSWFLKKYNHALIQPISRNYVAPSQKLPGAGGYEVWTFKINSTAFDVPQWLAISLAYARPWSPQSAKVQTFTVVTQ